MFGRYLRLCTSSERNKRVHKLWAGQWVILALTFLLCTSSSKAQLQHASNSYFLSPGSFFTFSSCCLLSRPPLPSFSDAPSPVLNHTYYLWGYTHIFNLYITKGKWKIRALHFNLTFLFQWTSQDAECLTQTSMLEVGDDTFTMVCHSQKPFYHWIALPFWLLRMPLL